VGARQGRPGGDLRPIGAGARLIEPPFIHVSPYHPRDIAASSPTDALRSWAKTCRSKMNGATYDIPVDCTLGSGFEDQARHYNDSHTRPGGEGGLVQQHPIAPTLRMHVEQHDECRWCAVGSIKQHDCVTGRHITFLESFASASRTLAILFNLQILVLHTGMTIHLVTTP